MSCPNPGQNLITTVREQFIFKTIKKSWTHHAKQNRSLVTFNSVLHTRTWENLIIFNHDSRIRKTSNHDSQGKKSPKHASRKKYKRPLVNHGSRQRASFIYFIKYLTYLHLDHALIWLLNRFKRFWVRSNFCQMKSSTIHGIKRVFCHQFKHFHCLTWKTEN